MADDRRVVIWYQEESSGIEGVQVDVRETTANHDNDYTDKGKTNGAGFIDFHIDSKWLNFDMRFAEPSGLVEFIDGQSVGPNMTYIFNRTKTAPLVPDLPQDVPDLSVEGKTFTNRGQFWVPKFVDMLSALRPDRSEADWRAYFEWALRSGFNGVRVFAGALTWANQTADGARTRLPTFLAIAGTYKLAVEVTAVTDSKGYDWRQHLAAVADICEGYSWVLLECANEVGHSTQASDLTFDAIRSHMPDVDYNRPWACGAPEYGYTNPVTGQHLDRDEPWPVDPNDPGGKQYAEGRGGYYVTAHLDRGRDFWNQGRRIREIFALSETEDVPALNNEPGRDFAEPAWFAMMGALDRAFSSGGVCHYASGVDATLPTAAEIDLTRTYVGAVDVVNAILQGRRGTYKNAGHEGSPVARYTEEQWEHDIVRHYSFVIDDRRAASIVIGLKNPHLVLNWTNGYRPTSDRPLASVTRGDGSQLQIWEVAR